MGPTSRDSANTFGTGQRSQKMVAMLSGSVGGWWAARGTFLERNEWTIYTCFEVQLDGLSVKRKKEDGHY